MHPSVMPIRRLSRQFAIAALLGAAALPARAQSARTDSVAPLPSITLPAALDRVLRDYEQGWRAGDARALAALFSEDGFVLQSGRPPVRGRAAIEKAYAGQGGPLHLRAFSYAVGDSIGFIIGAYGYPRAGAAPGAPVPDMGKFTLTLKGAADGRWLIFSDMDNPSVRRQSPASTPAAPTGASPAGGVPTAGTGPR
jgi:ketosteroid isomerase-like protein